MKAGNDFIKKAKVCTDISKESMGFLCGFEIIQAHFLGFEHMLKDMIKMSKEIQNNAGRENVAESLAGWSAV